MPVAKPMPSLYRRLKAIGYDQPFLRAAVLPDWWEDQLAEDAGALMQVQLRLARRLGLSLADVSDAKRPLKLPETSAVRLKRATKNANREDIAAGINVARRTVALVLPHLQGLPPFPAHLKAADLRSFIMKTYPVVDFAGLVKAAWAHGIAVFHFHVWPNGVKKVAGMAYYEGNVPVIVLASGYDAPPRLAFHLAHEIGHILRGHVKPGGKVLVDGDLDSTKEDGDEHEADLDALAILQGKAKLAVPPIFGTTAMRLRAWARRMEQDQKVHSGTAALAFGRECNRMPVAMAALKLMNMDTGGRNVVAAEMRRHLLPEDGSVEARDLPGAVLEVLPLLGLETV